MRIFALLAAAGLVVVCRGEPPCHMTEIMSCLDIGIDYLHSLPRRTLPESEEGVQELCSNIDEMSKCCNKFRKSCMSNIQQELVNLLTEGMADLRKDFCTDGSSLRAKYLTHVGCLNSVVQSDATNEYLQYMLAAVEKVMAVPLKDKITVACCGYDKMYQSIRKKSTETCGEEATEAGIELITIAVAQLPDIVCNGFDGEGEECQKVLPAEGSKPTNEIKENSVYKFIYNILRNHVD